MRNTSRTHHRDRGHGRKTTQHLHNYAKHKPHAPQRQGPREENNICIIMRNTSRTHHRDRGHGRKTTQHLHNYAKQKKKTARTCTSSMAPVRSMFICQPFRSLSAVRVNWSLNPPYHLSTISKLTLALASASRAASSTARSVILLQHTASQGLTQFCLCKFE